VLRILAGLQESDSGTVELGAGGGFTPGRDVGMVFQQPLLLKWRTVLENVLLPAQILRLERAGAEHRARGLLDMVGLGGAADRMPWELSGGMQQRAAIARALVHDPRLVLMDEPFGALDAITRERMNLEMLRIRAETGKTFVLVTHSIPEAIFLGSRCAVLTAGPARMADFFPIDLDFPRTLAMKAGTRFGELSARVYRRLGLENGDPSIPAPG